VNENSISKAEFQNICPALVKMISSSICDNRPSNESQIIIEGKPSNMES